jgi:hypothetical protein
MPLRRLLILYQFVLFDFLDHDTSQEKSMSLAEKLDALRAASASAIPEDALAVMNNAKDALLKSDALSWVPKIGETLSGFTLKNAYGVDVHSSDLLSQGPVVLSAFRGTW